MPSSQSRSRRRDPRPAAVGRSSTGAVWFARLAPWLFFAVTFAMCCFPMQDYDFWWHVKTGQLIWSQGEVPRTDWYTYTDADKPWIDMHWGFQLLLAGIYGWLGVSGVVLVKAAVYTSSVAAGGSAAGRGLPAFQRLLVWVPAMIALTGRAYERPEMLSMLFLSIGLVAMERARSSPKWLWIWPPLMLVWANCHALFVLGGVVWCACVAQALWDRFNHRAPAANSAAIRGPSLRLLGLITGLIVVAVLLNPWTIEGLTFPLVLYRKLSVERDFYAARVGEFIAPLQFVQELMSIHGPVRGVLKALQNLYFTAEALVFLIGLASFVRPLKLRRVRMDRLLVFIGFSHLAWVAARNTGVFSLVTAVVACGNFDDGRTGASEDVSGKGEEWVLANQLATLALGVLMVFYVSGAWGELIEEWKTPGVGEVPHLFGHDAARFCGRPGMPRRAFLADFALAGPYEYHNGPDRKVFMDARLEVCSRQTFRKYDRVRQMIAERTPGWEEIVNPDGQETPVLVFDSRTARAEIIGLLGNRSWRLVFADPSAAVFLHNARADQLGLPDVDPGLLDEMAE